MIAFSTILTNADTARRTRNAILDIIEKDQLFYTYRTPFGSITLEGNGTAVTRVCLGKRQLTGTRKADTILNQCANELLEYCAGKRMVFSVPTEVNGTDFQKRVWAAAATIPYGQSLTAKEVAEIIGEPQSYRMVGQAVKKNPLVLLIPAHRILSAGNDDSAKMRAAFRELEKRFA